MVAVRESMQVTAAVLDTAVEAEAPKKLDRNEILDAWRGLSMLTIFAGHAVAATAMLIQSTSPDLSFTMRKGGFFFAFGLSYFFVFSGSLITRILLQSKDTPHYFRNYYVRRILRIFPVYYGMLAVCLILGPAIFGRENFFHHILKFSASPNWLWFYGTNIIQSIKHDWCFGWLVHLWSLAVEEHFYLVWPILVAFVPRKHLITLCWALIGTSTVARVLLALGPASNGVALRVNTLCNMDCIAAGAIVSILLVSGSKPQLEKLARGLIVAGCAVFPLYALVAIRFPQYAAVVCPNVCALMFSGVILKSMLIPGSCRLPGHAVLKELGKYCYGLYLFHYPIIQFVVASHMVLPSWPVPVILGAITLFSWAVLAPLAFASYHLWEMPFLKMKDKFDYFKEQPGSKAIAVTRSRS